MQRGALRLGLVGAIALGCGLAGCSTSPSPESRAAALLAGLPSADDWEASQAAWRELMNEGEAGAAAVALADARALGCPPEVVGWAARNGYPGLATRFLLLTNSTDVWDRRGGYVGLSWCSAEIEGVTAALRRGMEETPLALRWTAVCAYARLHGRPPVLRLPEQLRTASPDLLEVMAERLHYVDEPLLLGCGFGALAREEALIRSVELRPALRFLARHPVSKLKALGLAALTQLEDFGWPAVPEIVAGLDDRNGPVLLRSAEAVRGLAAVHRLGDDWASGRRPLNADGSPTRGVASAAQLEALHAAARKQRPEAPWRVRLHLAVARWLLNDAPAEAEWRLLWTEADEPARNNLRALFRDAATFDAGGPRFRK